MKHIYSKQNRALLAELVRTDFKLRYQGSVLGYAWSLLRPLFIFLILYIVFVKFLKFGDNISHYPIYLLLGIVMWNFFSEITTQGLGSIVSRGDLIKKIKIPRWIIILSSSLSSLINLGLNLIVVFLFMLINEVDLLNTSLIFPITLLQLYVFSLGIALFLSTAFVKYRDVSYIWEVLLQAGFYATPILYPLTLIANENIQKIMLLNPVAQTIQDARYETVTHETITIWQVFDGGYYAVIPVLVTIITFVLGVIYFRKESKYFAENI